MCHTANSSLMATAYKADLLVNCSERVGFPDVGNAAISSLVLPRSAITDPHHLRSGGDEGNQLLMIGGAVPCDPMLRSRPHPPTSCGRCTNTMTSGMTAPTLLRIKTHNETFLRRVPARELSRRAAKGSRAFCVHANTVPPGSSVLVVGATGGVGQLTTAKLLEV